MAGNDRIPPCRCRVVTIEAKYLPSNFVSQVCGQNKLETILKGIFHSEYNKKCLKL